MRKTLALFAVVASLLAVAASSAAASTTLVYDESVPANGVTFIPACTPGVDPGCTDPRGPGSVLITNGDLLQSGTRVGTVYVYCTTTSVVSGDYYGYCEETLTFSNGALYAHGTVDESAIERYEPQTISIYAGGGIYGGKTGTLEILQTSYPDQFRLTATLN